MPKSIPEINIGGETYQLKDRVARDHLVEVGSTQPTVEDNKLWIKEQENEYTVPTYAEFSALKTALYENNGTFFKNLYNKDTSLANTERDAYTGNPTITTQGVTTSDWFYVDVGKTIYFSADGNPVTPYYIYEWNTDDVYQRRINGTSTFTPLPGTLKISICFNSNYANNLMAEYDSIGEYEPHGPMARPAYELAKQNAEKVNKVSYGVGSLLDDLPETPLETIRMYPGFTSTLLTVGCIGDSLCSGLSSYYDNPQYQNIQYKEFYEYSWPQFMARMTGNKYYNFSYGGLNTRTWLTSQYAQQCYDGEHNCTAYIIGLGQNDYNDSIPLGTISDIKEDYTDNPDTYYGNYGKIIQRIKAMFPATKPKVFVATDPLQAVETAGYNSAVRAIANKFDNVWLIDLYTYARTILEAQPFTGWKRNAHFNASAYFYFACIMQTYIDWIIRTHYDYFCCTELIKDGYYMYSHELR